MFKMLIVDDNNRDRRMLQTILDWGALGIEVISTAADGEEALAQVGQTRPDIILTDIAMPGLNGIELAVKLKLDYPEIKIVFMSCYDDFQYAHAAVNLNTSGYVLKPVVVDDLKSVMAGAVAALEKERTISRERTELESRMSNYLDLMRDSFAREWLLGCYTHEEDLKQQIAFLRMDIPRFPYWAVLLVGLEESGQGVKDRYIADTAVRSRLAWKDGTNRWFLPVKTGADRLACVLGIDRKRHTDAQNDAVEAAALLQTLLADVVKNRGAIAVSETAGSLTDVPMLYAQAEETLENRAIYSRDASVLLYKDLRDENSLGLVNDYGIRLVKMAAMELLAPADDARDAVKAFASRYGADFKPATHLMLEVLLAAAAEQGNGALTGARAALHKLVEESISAQEATGMLADHIGKLAGEASEDTQSWEDKVVWAIKSVIHSSYMSQISLMDIANSVNYSAKQANNIFKRQTGMNIFDYMIEYRMKVASTLLAEKPMSINAVALSVGYNNVAHFKALFQRKYGEAPAAFRDARGRKLP